LQPELPEAHLAQGYCYYYGDRDYDRALAEFAIARRGLPNDAETFLAIAAIERRQGKWEASTANFEKAAGLDPKSAIIWQNLAMNHFAMRNPEAGSKAYDRALAAAPDSFNLKMMKAKMEFEWNGKLEPLVQLMAIAPADYARKPEVAAGQASVFLSQRKYEEALRVLLATPDDAFQVEDGFVPKSYVLAAIYRAGGDPDRARPYFEAARTQLEAAIRLRPDSAMLHSKLGLTYAGLGRADEAIREGRRAMELMPESLDALDGPTYTVMMAQIYASLGRADDALPLIEHLLRVPAGINRRMLQSDPAWDPLRQDPRFQNLLTQS
jgi:serine/threonine-protein kinase